MIQRIFTPKNSVVLSASTIQFKLIAIMLIVQFYKVMTIPKLQVCLWGIQHEENLQMIIRWKKEKKITNAPWLADEDITPLVMQCVSNRLLKLNVKESCIKIELDSNAHAFLSEISNIEITHEIDAELKQIGKLSDTLLKNIEFDY